MHVKSLSSEDSGGFEELAKRDGGVFYGAGWRSVFSDGLLRFGVFGENGDLAGVLQCYEERRFGVRLLRNLPFTPVCGPLIVTRSSHPVAVLEERRKVLEALAGFLAGRARGITSLSLDHRIDDVMPFCWQGFKATPRYTYQLDLGRSFEEICRGFTATRRNDISKARRDGLTVSPASDLRVVSALVRGTYDRQSARLDSVVLERILFHFARPENSYGFVTQRAGRAIACTFVVHDQDTAYYVLGGYDARDRHHGAGALAVAESVREAQRRGMRTFDFEGSMIPAIERYFRGFGGELVHFFTVSRAWLPLEMLLKLSKRSLF